MKKNLFLILTVVLLLAFAVPAFAALSSGFTVQEKKAPETTGIVCNPGDCQQACGGDPALCAQGGCNQANCPNAGVGCGNGAACGTGAACDGGGCSNAAAAGCGGGGCGGGGCGI